MLKMWADTEAGAKVVRSRGGREDKDCGGFSLSCPLFPGTRCCWRSICLWAAPQQRCPHTQSGLQGMRWWGWMRQSQPTPSPPARNLQEPLLL